MHVGSGHTLGERGGEQAHTLTISASCRRTSTSCTARRRPAANRRPTSDFLASATTSTAAPANLTTLHPATISNVGGSQPHTNMQPYLVLNFCIALQGIFPSQN